jgi:hypothetical protein
MDVLPSLGRRRSIILAGNDVVLFGVGEQGNSLFDFDLLAMLDQMGYTIRSLS